LGHHHFDGCHRSGNRQRRGWLGGLAQQKSRQHSPENSAFFISVLAHRIFPGPVYLHFLHLQHALIAGLLALGGLQPAFAEDESQPIAEADQLTLPSVEIVSGQARAASDEAAATALVDDETIQNLIPAHAAEIMAQVPGTWVTNGSGQEHLTAIRSPVLTGAGACGAFLFMEDGIAVRPSGFCNINNLFELNLVQAATIEVQRGPGSARYGSNAQHGLINVVSSRPFVETGHRFGIDLGSDDFYRLRLNTGDSDADQAWRLKAYASDAGSFREHEGYNEQKLNFVYATSNEQTDWTLRLAATRLDQETAGYVLGEDAYRDDRRFSNANPEAFRRADAQRLALHRDSRLGAGDLRLSAWARHSDMTFRMHFLPGKPLEENGQQSAGLAVQWQTQWQNIDFSSGLDGEWADSFLRQSQETPYQGPSDFLRATRPVGDQYDFQTDSLLLGAWARANWDIGPLQLQAGLRAETIRYDYDNLIANGNLRDDGTACGFGGCVYNRPADRKDRFYNLRPELGLVYNDAPGQQWFVRITDGYRAPQINELYRLQRGQDVVDIDNEQLLSVEAGRRWWGADYQFSLSLYSMRKRNAIFDDADGFVVDDGQTQHQGIELDAFWQLSEHWQTRFNGSFARHTIEQDREIGNGEVVRRGNQLAASPGRLFNAWLVYQPNERQRVAWQWQHVGNHWLDLSNRRDYPGHDLLHLSLSQQLRPGFTLRLRLHNLLDERYAERPDYAFGNYRYFPGEGRALRASLDWTL
jgi:outer membrane receptor protein involved in Fe transport